MVERPGLFTEKGGGGGGGLELLPQFIQWRFFRANGLCCWGSSPPHSSRSVLHTNLHVCTSAPPPPTHHKKARGNVYWPYTRCAFTCTCLQYVLISFTTEILSARDTGRPNRILFVEELTALISESLPDFWKLGQAYFCRSLFQVRTGQSCDTHVTV